jgi:CHAT domain-containing protein
VTADACETGLIEVSRGAEQYQGFPAAFLAAGARTVVAAFWSVDDFSSALLIEKVFTLMREKSMPPAAAMREATSWLRQLDRETIIDSLESEIVPMWQAREEGLWKELDAEGASLRYRYDKLLNERNRIHKDRNPFPFRRPYYWAAFGVHGNDSDDGS